MSRHTAGPWFVSKGPFKNGLAVYMPGGMRPIAHIKPLQQCEPNADLIAAAPEMLEMLKRLATISTMDLKWDEEILALIDKAEGRV
jgi:hypothetical protein